MRRRQNVRFSWLLFIVGMLAAGRAEAGGAGTPMGGPPKGPDAPALMKKTTNDQRWAAATRNADRRAEAIRKNGKNGNAQRKGGK